MKTSFMESNEPMLKRFELWAKTLADYANSKEFKQPLEIDRKKLFKGLPESEVNSNAIMRSYPIPTPSGEEYVPYTLCPAIAEAKERPFPPFMYRTFLLNNYEYRLITVSHPESMEWSIFDPRTNLLIKQSSKLNSPEYIKSVKQEHSFDDDICKPKAYIINLFEHANYLLPRYLPQQFQLSDVIAFINTGALLFDRIIKNEFSDQTIEIYFKDNNLNFQRFDLIFPSDKKFSYVNYGVSSISASRLPFIVCTMTKDDPCFTTSDGKYVTGSDGKPVPKITRMKEAEFIIEEKDHSKKIITGKGHTFRTNEEIKQAHPDRFRKTMTLFEEDTTIQNYRIQEQDRYNTNQLKNSIHKDTPPEIRKNIIINEKYKFLSTEYKRNILLNKSKNYNLLNLIIRAIQNKIIKLTKTDNEIYNKLIELLTIEPIVNKYNRQDSDKTSFQIIKETIRNCKIQTTFNGFKRLIVSSLTKQGRSAYADEQKHKQGRSAFAFESEDNPKEKSPVWLDHLDADKYYKINKTTFYREIERNKNDKTRVTYPLKQLSQRYCEDLSERLKIRNDKIKENKDIIPAIAKHFKVAQSTVQKHLPFYWEKYKKVIAQEKKYSIQEKNKISAIIHPKREIIRHPLKH